MEKKPSRPKSYVKKDEKKQKLIEYLKNIGVMKYKDSELEVSFYPPDNKLHNANMPEIKSSKSSDLLPSDAFEKEMDEINKLMLKRF